MKKLADTLILSGAFALLLISLHQMALGRFVDIYWLFMLTLGLFMWYTLRKKRVESK